MMSLVIIAVDKALKNKMEQTVLIMTNSVKELMVICKYNILNISIAWESETPVWF